MFRFTLAGYHENLYSVAYPGDRHGYEYCKPAVQSLLQHWPWSVDQRRQVILRSDAEQGTDRNISYLLWLGFQVLMKGFSGRRTQAWVKRIAEDQWQADPERADRWLAPAPVKLRLGRKVQAYVLRWRTVNQGLDQATLLTTLPDPIFGQWHLYDGRAASEIEIRSDKSGLDLHHRRKQSLNAQEGWILLTDLAHNLLAWLHPWMLCGSAFDSFGPKRILHDLLTIPGRVTLEEGRLVKVALLQTHPYADEMRSCLHNVLTTFDLG